MANDLWAAATTIRDLPDAFEEAKRFYRLYGGIPYDFFARSVTHRQWRPEYISYLHPPQCAELDAL
jgi:hypothetical protein